MYSMTNTNVKYNWKLFAVEYNGIGTEPYLVFRNEIGEIKMIPIKKGNTNLRSMLYQKK